MTTKLVRFYQPICIERDGTRVEFSDGFWVDVRQQLSSMTVQERTASIHLAPYFGEAAVGLVRASPFIRVGRVRKPADFPDTLSAAGVVAPLQLDDADIFEGAYVVPFGPSNRIAFMGPLRGALVTHSTVASWLTQVLGFVQHGRHVEFVPEIDPNLLDELAKSDGLKRLKVQVAKGSTLPTPERGRGAIEDALQQAVQVAGDDFDVVMGFSAGHATPSRDRRRELRETAKRLVKHGGAKSIEVGMLLEDDNGTRVKTVDLLKNRVGFRVEIPADPQTRVSTDEILEAVDDAIKQFRGLT